MANRAIAIDGPAGAGKSTIAKKLAAIIGYTYIDSGAMYRALTLKALVSGVNFADKEKIVEIARETVIEFESNSIYLDGRNADVEIREERVNRNVSLVAAIPEVRRILVELQRKISVNKDVVMDGRDVGTVIFPDAFLKIFLTASVEERAERRCRELAAKGYPSDLNDIRLQIEERDRIDSSRSDSPLKAAEDAVFVDTTGKSIDEVVCEVIKYLELKGGGISVL